MSKNGKQTQGQEERKRETLRLAVEASRQKWLGKRVLFMGFLNTDLKEREGRFTAVHDEREVIFSGPVYPWDDEDRVTELRVGDEEELLSVIAGRVVEDGTAE